MRLRRAGCKSQKTLESFDFAFNASINRSLVLDLATCRFLEEKANIIIAGPCGTGKSHLAQALWHCAIHCDHDVFLTLTQMLQQIQAARAVGSYDRKFQYLTRVDLLVSDDFGLKPLTLNQDDRFP